MADPASQRLSYAEYLTLEHTSGQKHEYLSGVVRAMAGGSPEHGRLTSRMTYLLSRALEGKPCNVFSSDVRIRIRTADRATYPDLSVVCGQLEHDRDDVDALTNPVVSVEVLSDSTGGSDRGEKFADYRRLVSLREYVLVSQRERRIDVYRREGRRWTLDEHGPGERARLASIDVEIDVDELYRNPAAS